MRIQTGVTVRKRLSWVVTSVTLTFDLWPWPWPFAWTLLWSLVITPENFMMIRWGEHSQKGVTDGRTDRQTDRRTENTICRAAWSQLKMRETILILRINSSPLSAAYMHQWTGSALVQIMACHLFGANISHHYLNRCSHIVNWSLMNKPQWNFNQNTTFFIDENAFQNAVCETVAILSRERWVKNISVHLIPDVSQKRLKCSKCNFQERLKNAFVSDIVLIV